MTGKPAIHCAMPLAFRVACLIPLVGRSPGIGPAAMCGGSQKRKSPALVGARLLVVWLIQP
jgi:hypothetical protein